MQKIAIITLYGNNNYGNKLQNYALQEKLEKMQCVAFTLKNYPYSNNKKNFFIKILKHKIHSIFNKKDSLFKNRELSFVKFNKYINYYSKVINAYNSKKFKEFDYFIVGSDQVWNPNFWSFSDVERLSFASYNKRISYAASFGIESLNDYNSNLLKKDIKHFKAISVREDAGKKIVDELTGRTDVEVLIDPTMLLTADDWDKVSKKPTMLKNDKYILNYFLGNLSVERKNEINRVAKENNCEVINILDKDSPFYECGPSEFLYLEKNAFLICTDSFHSSVFGILYNTPFLVFKREDNNASMNSRLDTLLSKFKLEDRKYKGKITKKDLKCDYTEAYTILDKERIKSMNFLKKALNIKDSDKNE